MALSEIDAKVVAKRFLENKELSKEVIEAVLEIKCPTERSVKNVNRLLEAMYSIGMVDGSSYTINNFSKLGKL